MNSKFFLIYPNDPTVYFMNPILKSLKDYIESGKLTLITCDANEQAYKASLDLIKNIPVYSKVIFIGHSTPTILYGGHSSTFTRKPLLELRQMSIFKDIELFLISCFSEKLLKSSRPFRNYSKCLGFGLILSEPNEIQAHSGMKKLELNQEDIEIFKFHVSDIFSKVLKFMIINDASLEQAFNIFQIITNKKTNDVIINEKNEKIAELLYYLVQESLLDN
ncbi:hypothetical protein [Acinetobacter baumannii]|uniref:hypothetical protein n=1 Tax=Acinetobacter baumannii TaxID=470 RepID=UPI000810BDC5|nr:hypothetical protein [Acinetobacter baumannii]